MTSIACIDDVLDWLARLARKGREFDVVILDPPTFSQSKESGVFRARKDYGKLVAAALRVLKKPGTLFASTNAADWEPEEEILDSKRRTLAWPGRQRRYHIKEELAQAENAALAARTELEELGVVVLDAELGRVGFPTMVNNRKAFFSWQPGNEGLHWWHFAEETHGRPIPQSWLKEINLSATN